jgi:hypothetical protein
VSRFESDFSKRIKVPQKAADIFEIGKLLQGGAPMGISPITSLTPLSIARPLPRDLEPLPMARVENSARSGDETYSPSDGKSAGGSDKSSSEEDGFEEDGFERRLAGADREDELSSIENEDGAQGIAQPDDSSYPSPISYFA